MKRIDQQIERACSLCGTTAAPVFDCDGGQVCEACAETTREGRDNTSRALKTMRTANVRKLDLIKDQANVHEALSQQEYAIVSGQLMSSVLTEVVSGVQLGSGGEAINSKAGGMVNTLTEPTVASLEASNHRTELLTMLGTDIAAMALDAAATVEAANSLEMMLAHQMAAIHQLSMKMAHRASLIQDPAVAVKTMNAAMKGFSTYQGGLAALRHLRGTQQQHIVVQHVNVASGGQAMVGNVNTEGRA